jgi:hypothetical protein
MTVTNTVMPQALWPGLHDWWSKQYSDYEFAEAVIEATIPVPVALAMGAAAAVIANPVVTRRFLPD